MEIWGLFLVKKKKTIDVWRSVRCKDGLTEMQELSRAPGPRLRWPRDNAEGGQESIRSATVRLTLARLTHYSNDPDKCSCSRLGRGHELKTAAARRLGRTKKQQGAWGWKPAKWCRAVDGKYSYVCCVCDAGNFPFRCFSHLGIYICSDSPLEG